MILVETSGPLFAGQIHVTRGTRLGMARATERAAEIARGHLRRSTRYSTPKYGRAAQSVRTKVTTVGGTGEDQMIGRAFIGGQAAYLARWLEFGVNPYDIPSAKKRRGRVRIQTRASRTGLRRTRVSTRTVTLMTPWGLRSYSLAKPLKHPGTRATRWASQTQTDINRLAPDIIRQALRESGA